VSALQPDPATLVARTRRLDLDLDLADIAGEDGTLFVRDDVGLAARGVATRVGVSLADGAASARHVSEVLGAIGYEGETGPPGTGPLAVGALPFRRDEAGELVIPELVVSRAPDGTRWLTTIGDADDDVEARLLVGVPERQPEPSAPTRFDVTADQDPVAWCEVVTDVRDALDGEFRKVVLARSLTVQCDRPLSRAGVMRTLRRAYPSCTLFSIDGFVGATPELLVSRAGDVVRSHPLAGTAPRSADPTGDARLAANLLSSPKDRAEHRVTIDMVHDTLLPWCSYLDEEAEPSIVSMANVQHLGTSVEGRLSSPAASVLELMSALHPTPAVGGVPRDRALAVIERVEVTPRGRYGGPVGWVDRDGNGMFVVGIRSAQIDGDRARLWAGVGVLADSDPQAELAETQAKFQAVLSAVVRP
jgi:menaquinone-specific isochorismate synthase